MNGRIFSKVKAYMKKYEMLVPDDTVVAGVSGGADSVCLLLMLCEIAKEVPIHLVVVHVNHGFREEAKRDADYVGQLCKERGLPFFLVEEDVRAYAKREKLSEEEAGRKVRYFAFAKVLKEQTKGKGKIAVAHNAGDRVETMLFHLFRGTGLAGASGIKPVRENVIRPLLCLHREEIEEYLAEKGVPFCIDRTNLEDTYTRNRIRNHILPFAEREICKGASEHMWEAADMLLETEEYIRKQAEKIYESCKVTIEGTEQKEEAREVINSKADAIVLRADVLTLQEPFMQKQVLLRCLEELTGHRRDITSVHIEDIRKLLNRQGSKQISLPYGLIATKEYGSLTIGTSIAGNGHCKAKEKGPALAISIPGTVQVPGLGEVEFSVFSYEKTQIIPEKSYTKWFDYDRITRSLAFRQRETGDYLTINEDLSKKTLKNYMIGEKIPKSQRGELYVLTEGSHVLWVPGYRISQYYKVTEYTKSILEVRLRGGLFKCQKE
ncbi:tRNA lysidine(34) synthetase TilS [Kineothrix sp. MB12-C1]|uniref:tRNA lysidine(34) synthetase TilS n=1 Tax=Kineothrix sp. MB12-C1 TaxID=3070215 RepID=UPI0027D323CA|nr:tRNA lysidine(34) synthetase TilS [Kineothrix sp. MB12-C1]WMC91209.1 tRNA lysidine(34) synthetase TilS [Kineothrix sp. MB12-C1]